MINKKTMLLLLMLIFVLAFGIGYMYQQTKLIQEEVARLEAELELLKIENVHLRIRIQELRLLRNTVLERMEQWLNGWQEYDVSFYAPLDPKATEGMCFEGDRTITASGAIVEIGVTAAAGPEIPFGTWVYVEGYGWRQVQDRGGRITEGKLDIAVSTVKEALREGRKKLKVWRAIVNH